MIEPYQIVLIFLLGIAVGCFFSAICGKQDKDWDRIMKRENKKAHSFQIDDCDLDFFEHEGARFVLINKGKEVAIRQIK
jgi:hypothetical protein